jgi:carbamoyl-phosphate synthase small subunit
MTYPQIGNVGVNLEDIESRRPFMRGFIVKDYTAQPSNWRASQPLHEYMRANGIVGIYGIDTRALVRHLRDHGAQEGVISTGTASAEELVAKAKAAPGMVGQDLVKCHGQSLIGIRGCDLAGYKRRWQHCSEAQPQRAGAEIFVVAYDFGIKYNILRKSRRVRQVRVVPASTPMAKSWRSNRMGLPFQRSRRSRRGSLCENVQKLIGKPISHLLGSPTRPRLGGKLQLKFGHHGGNQPVMDLTTRNVEITSQNHGFAVDADSLGGAAQLTHVNLNDNTVEGLAHRELPIFSVQYHPESSPGPHDANYLFKRFIDLMAQHRGS